MMVDGTHEVYNCKEESTEQSTAPEGKRETCALRHLGEDWAEGPV